MMEHSQKQPLYEVQTTPLDSEGEDEHTPIFNRFQSLEDLETEDTLQKLESMQNITLPADTNVSERGNETINITHTFEIRSDIDGHNQEGQELDAVYFTCKFAFHFVFSNSNNKIWCFAKLGVDIQIIRDHTQFLHVKVNSGAFPEDIFCTIYAKCYRTPRRILSDELTRISHQNVPWLVGGDFNAILHPNENQGGDMRRIGSMDDFNDMMFDTGLIDAGFEGEPFTWTNNRVWRRLDRVLYSKEWTESFNTTRVLHLPRRLSDHHPLLINATNVEDKKPSSFRFQNMWLKHHTFLDTVKQSWCLPTEGYGMYKLQQKIYRIKVLLKLWNKDTSGNVFTTVEQAKQNATEAEKRFNMDPSEANLIDLKRSNAALVHALTLKSEYWKQKISEECTRIISSLPTDEEIRETVFSIGKESVASPDGFSSAFYQACWDFIAIDIFEAVKDFFHGTPMPRSFTATTIVLVPKVESPQTWNDFRPISLCNVTNKILSKLIYNKLHNTLPDLISPSQSGFVPGRLIGDNILMAQEMIHQLDLRYNKGNLVIKLDISKAYDRVNWNFRSCRRWDSLIDSSLLSSMPPKTAGLLCLSMEKRQDSSNHPKV
ncbi:uncharacterized protein LOC105164454 [Sesamum indicum]|uniref:Uncharacterized protein LOC105164454 n=1 Tax=Sesamum indicum TaxID=4182 RepID=A0A6I9TAM6_SESIN|nr:uncharacterized protein LOC105164454 [Sesamum indicum]